MNSLTKKDQKVFYKILESKKEYEIYNTIKKERDNVLKIILNFLKEEGKDQDEIKQLMEEIEDEKKEDLFYSILSGKEGNICKEIYENIKKDQNYSNFDIISAFKKIKDKEEKKTEGDEKEEKKTEEPTMPLLQAYYIKLWCFNFISINYPCNEEYLEKIKEEIKNNEELKKKFMGERKTTLIYELNHLDEETIIILEEGKTLKSIQKAQEDKDDLSKLRKGDKKKFQKLIQHIIKQLSIGLYLFHHLSKSESLFHNDLKPDNALIIIDEKETDLYKKYMSSTIKVVDLDLTRKINMEELNKDFYKKMYKEDLFPYDDPDKEEIYEVGEIMFELLTGEMFNRGNQKEINVKNKVMEKNCIIRADYELCESIIKFLHSTLKTNRAYRINCDEAFEHPFFKEEQFEKVNFDKLPNELTSSDKSRFYLPIYRKYLALKNYEMEIEDGNKCLVEEF